MAVLNYKADKSLLETDVFTSNCKQFILSRLQGIKEHPKGFTAKCPFCGASEQKRGFLVFLSTDDQTSITGFNCCVCAQKGGAWKLAKYLKDNGFTPNVNISKLAQKASEKILVPCFKRPDHLYIDPNTQKPYLGKSIIRKEFDPIKGKRKKVTPWAQYINGNWFNGSSEYKGPMYLYNIHRYKEATIAYHLVEGEIKCNTLQARLQRGHVALSVHGGANSRISQENIPFMTGRKVYIYSDLDTKHSKGQEAAIRWQDFFTSNSIESYIIDVCNGNEPPFSGYDVCDYLLKDAHDFSDLKRLIDSVSDRTNEEFKNRYIINQTADNKFEFYSKYVNTKLTPHLLNNKCTLIKSVHGTGKTEFVKMIINDAAKRDVVTIVLTHRINLADQLSNRLGIIAYNDEAIQQFYDKPKKKFLIADSMIITADSIFKLNLPEYKDKKFFVIIDEIDQYFDHYIRGRTCRRNRKIIAQCHQFLFKHAAKIVGLSSDIPSKVEQILKVEHEINAPLWFINNYIPSHKTFIIYEKFSKEKDVTIPGANPYNELLAQMMQDAASGYRISVASATKNELIRLEVLFRKKYPDRKTLIVTEDNTQNPTVKAIKQNPELLLAYDFFGYSPAMFSGVDFNVDFAKTHYLISKCGPLNGYELLQGAMRMRQASTIRVFISHNTGSRPIFPEKIRERLLVTRNEFRDYGGIDMDTGEMGVDTSLVKAYCYLQADHNCSLNMLRDSFINIALQNGYQVIRTKDRKHHLLRDASLLEETNADVKKVRESLKEQNIQGLTGARVLSKKEYDCLSNGQCENDDDVYAVDAHEFIEINSGLKNGIEDIYKQFHSCNPEQLAAKIDNFERTIRKTDEENMNDDLKAQEMHLYDQPNYLQKASIRKIVLLKTGLLEGKGIGRYEKLGLAEYIGKESETIGRLIGCESINMLGFVPSVDEFKKVEEKIQRKEELSHRERQIYSLGKIAISSIGYWLRDFLGTLCLKLKSQGANNNRKYYLDQERIRIINAIIDRKQTRNLQLVQFIENLNKQYAQKKYEDTSGV